jgi:hypothetical protein
MKLCVAFCRPRLQHHIDNASPDEIFTIFFASIEAMGTSPFLLATTFQDYPTDEDDDSCVGSCDFEWTGSDSTGVVMLLDFDCMYVTPTNPELP